MDIGVHEGVRQEESPHPDKSKRLNDRSLPQDLPVQKFLENSRFIRNFLSNSANAYRE